MSDELSRRRSLDSLKKEAKRWLSALREQVHDARARLERVLPNAPALPTLRDVQHALALEHGFPGWTAFKDQLVDDGKASATTRAQYETMAVALFDAYRTGTPEAMERHWSFTWHRRPWQGMRTYVQLDLGKIPGDDVDITLDDARHLVALDNGFASWSALEQYVATMSTRTPMAARPVRVTAPSAQSDDRTIASSRDWNTILRTLAQQPSAGLAAEGQMTDKLLGDVSGIESVSSLELGGSKMLTDDGVRHLARLPHLKHLDLSGTAITDRALDVLRHLPELETLSLAMTHVTDAGIAQLSACEKLERVNLSWTHTGDGAIRALAGKQHLRHLWSGNLVTDAGLALLHELPVFKRWHGGVEEMGLTSYQAGPNYLFLRGSFTDRGMVQLRGLDGLFALNLDAKELAVTAAGLAPLVTLPHLGWLAFDADDDAMPYIAAMPTLRFLACQDTVAGDDGFIALSRSRSIEYIWGRRCHDLRRRGFIALSTMPTLRALSVSCLNVDDIGIATLPSFPALRELMPMDVPDEGYRHIGHCEQLESLVLMYCRDTTDRATEHLVGLPALERYFASYTRITDRTPELLSEIGSLESVTFDGCAGVTNAGIAALARLPKLRELRVSGARITADVADAFPAGVSVRYSL
jgi:Leucine-rich repeat (LRR) protein